MDKAGPDTDARKSKSIKIRGARAHNLCNIDIDIPRNSFVVFTGVSGSGKSSLAFDTIFAEGRRRYVESLSAYARMFLDKVDRPDVDSIEGLGPAVAIDQKSTSRNPRSTVGTVTEIYDYMRVLWARIGIAHCVECGAEIVRRTVQNIADEVMRLPPRSRVQLLAPVVHNSKGQFTGLFEKLVVDGYTRAVVDGVVVQLSTPPTLSLTLRHSISVVIDRLVVNATIQARLTDSIETCLRLSGGTMEILVEDADGETNSFRYSDKLSCPNGHPRISAVMGPRAFSFNAPEGACSQCSGLGSHMRVEAEAMLGDPSLTIADGVILPWAQAGRGLNRYFERMLEALADKLQFSLDVPWQLLDAETKHAVLYGKDFQVTMTHRNRFGREVRYTIGFEGVIPWIERKFEEAETDAQRTKYSGYLRAITCDGCGGRRLSPEVLAVTIAGRSIADVTEMDLSVAAKFLTDVQLNPTHAIIAEPVLAEIRSRLSFLLDVGLSYLTMSRSAGTLSGGEAQRIRLATQIGSGLSGVVYVLDEPSIGLHQRDNDKLITTLRSLADLGNSLLVVEHDEDTIRAADWVVDVGPGAGSEGGTVMHSGTLDSLLPKHDSLTAQYLSGRRSIEIPTRRPFDSTAYVRVEGARANNLRDITVDFPLGLFTVVTGVSGSGKSTLVNDILYSGLANTLNGAQKIPGRHTRILGADRLQKVVHVDQSPIGRTPRSNPATYTGVFDRIRNLFAETTEAKVRGYTPARFSFNVKGGRCEACSGDGITTVEMNFLPDVHVECETCAGTRFNRETLEIRFKGKTIADVLAMSIGEAVAFFEAFTLISRYLTTLDEVGLGYVQLGQSGVTLSGGEAQRVKLATELQRRTRGSNLYILDEPTTGLHFEDIRRVLLVLQRLVDKGNTVVVIEHNLDVIKSADWLIDLGPEGGSGGGTVVTVGSPETVAKVRNSWTGKYLSGVLSNQVSS